MAKRNQRRIIIRLLAGALILFMGILALFFIDRYHTNRTVAFRTEGNQFQINRSNKWIDFPVEADGSLNIKADAPKSEYSHWFKEIAARGVNAVRIYTILPPDFYRAFFEYNVLTDKPVYLLQGIHISGKNEAQYQYAVQTEHAGQAEHAYENQLNSDILEGIRNTIDVIHGNAVMKHQEDNASLTYNLNVSAYVMGYILGRIMDGDFVIATNKKNDYIFGFDGDYLFTVNASPCEAWLAALGNYTVSYEQNKYGGVLKLVSWINTPATDPFEHPGVLYEGREYVAGVDLEHIRTTEKFSSGIFASYFGCPEERSGAADMAPCEIYLDKLKAYHTIPVMMIKEETLWPMQR